MNDGSRISVVHRKAAAEAFLDIEDGQSQGAQDEKSQRRRPLVSHRTVFSAIAVGLMLIIIFSHSSVFMTMFEKKPFQEAPTSPSLADKDVEIHRPKEVLDLLARVQSLEAELRDAEAGRMSQRSSLAAGQSQSDGKAASASLLSHASPSIKLLPQPDAVSGEGQHVKPSSSVFSHLLAFIDSLNSAGRNPRSDCDDPDFKDASLVNAFISKKQDICTSPSALQQSGASKISSSHIVCYQHQQARHSATDSICEGHNVALHLPSFEGSAMTGFVEATWMNMRPGALQAACSPTAPFSKDKFPLCLSDWFISGFKQVQLPSDPVAETVKPTAFGKFCFTSFCFIVSGA
jgi:hypothetical protein